MGAHKGEYRASAYFHAVTPVTDPAAASTVAGCAALCCKTEGCVVFSLTVNSAFTTTIGCTMGESCCSLGHSLGYMMKNTGPMVVTTGVVQGSPETGKPPGVNVSFDCAVRELAYNYARMLRPDKGPFGEVHDGLQLSTCGEALADTPSGDAPPAPDTIPSMVEFFVSATSGSDTANGTEECPFATIHRGIVACQAAAGTTCTVTIRGGTFYLGDKPVQLTAADSGLLLRSYPGEKAELSGGDPLTRLAWTRANVECDWPEQHRYLGGANYLT